MEDNFSFKKLIVWQKAMQFVGEVMDITESFEGHYRLKEQAESASASIAQNIAEGEGRISVKENIQYLSFARASLYEAVTLLNLFYDRKFITVEKLNDLEALGIEIVKMINQLIKRKRGRL